MLSSNNLFLCKELMSDGGRGNDGMRSEAKKKKEKLTCASIFDGSRRDFRLALLLLPHINCWTRVASEMNALSPVRAGGSCTNRPTTKTETVHKKMSSILFLFLWPVQKESLP